MEQDNRTEKYQQLRQLLNEKQWRQFLALEAKERGNILLVAREAGVSKNTVKVGRRELEAGDRFTPGKRLRAVGGGRKKQEEHDASLQADLEALLEPKGDPMSLLKWTTKSMAKLKQALKSQGHQLGETPSASGYTRWASRCERTRKPSRAVRTRSVMARLDTSKSSASNLKRQAIQSSQSRATKKELLGNFKNNGREWQAKGAETTVNVYDYLSLADGKAVPYGVYDLTQNHGFVNVGIDHDTAEFAVESIRRWWNQQGKRLYPGKTKLLITADGGGSNSSRSRLWKREMQHLANETGLCITVCHFPPGTSKWNKIEHRLFSYISINWRAKPLISLETVIELISHTTTEQGLVVTAIKDSNTYPTGIQISDEELKALHIVRDAFHGEWNYTFKPHVPASDGHVISA